MLRHLRGWTVPAEGRPTFLIARSVFLTILGLVYLSAFASFWWQARGLIGENGVLPIRQGLEELHQRNGAQSYVLAPTLLWFGASDEAIRTLCIAGCALPVLLVVGLREAPLAGRRVAGDDRARVALRDATAADRADPGLVVVVGDASLRVPLRDGRGGDDRPLAT